MQAGGRPPGRVAVVGSGLAGTYAVAGLRRRGFAGHVTLVGREPHRPYDRPPLSKRLLRGDRPTSLEDDLGATLEDLCDEVLLGTTATRLDADTDAVRVALPDRVLAADAVLLVGGAVPVVPAGWDGVRTLRTLDDAAGLRAGMTAGSRLVVVGAGWIGAEVAGAAAAAGCDVTVVEALDAPLAREVGAEAGTLTTRWYAEAGVRLLTGRRVVRADGDGVLLDDGRQLPADVVLAAVGVRPDVGWLTGSGLELGPGVRVGTDLRAAGPHHARVLAAGDCATRWSPRYATWMPGGHWEEAMAAGDAAAATLAGEEVEHDPAPYVFSTQFGRELGLVGHAEPGDRLVLRGDPSSGQGWTAAWVRPGHDGGGRLAAVLTVDRPHDLAQARRALTRAGGDAVDVDAARLPDPDVPLRSLTGR
jgi:3-phenylpropionate/trans-cinnamate dioxygenase ferredoxin reductase subunit